MSAESARSSCGPGSDAISSSTSPTFFTKYEAPAERGESARVSKFCVPCVAAAMPSSSVHEIVAVQQQSVEQLSTEALVKVLAAEHGRCDSKAASAGLRSVGHYKYRRGMRSALSRTRAAYLWFHRSSRLRPGLVVLKTNEY